MRQIPKSAIFFDRDGVINQDAGYTFRREDLKFCEGVLDGLRKLSALNQFALIVTTNQSGVARGYFTLQEVDAFHAAMQMAVERECNTRFDRFMICPHFEAGVVAPYNIACECRKPGTKNIEVCIREMNLKRENSFFVGDRWSDIECGQRAGLRTVLIPSAATSERSDAKTIQPDYLAARFTDAIDWILHNSCI